jgi:hypothetical protein
MPSLANAAAKRSEMYAFECRPLRAKKGDGTSQDDVTDLRKIRRRRQSSTNPSVMNCQTKLRTVRESEFGPRADRMHRSESSEDLPKLAQVPDVVPHLLLAESSLRRGGSDFDQRPERFLDEEVRKGYNSQHSS